MILRFFLASFTQNEKLEEGAHDLAFAARFKRKGVVYLLKNSRVEAIGLSDAFQTSLFVSKELWNGWSSEEQETALFWVYSAALKTSLLARLTGYFHPITVDRDTTLLAPSPLSLVGLLEKTLKYRATRPLKEGGILLAGLSLIGPSLVKDWPSVQERIKRISDLLLYLKSEEK